MEELIEKGEQFDEVIAIGPLPMMKFVCLLTKKYGIKTIVSMNPIMIDGTGMCGCCRLSVGGEMKFACVDGPDFDGHLVDFDEAMARNSAYRDAGASARSPCNLFQKEWHNMPNMSLKKVEMPVQDPMVPPRELRGGRWAMQRRWRVRSGASACLRHQPCVSCARSHQAFRISSRQSEARI